MRDIPGHCPSLGHTRSPHIPSAWLACALYILQVRRIAVAQILQMTGSEDDKLKLIFADAPGALARLVGDMRPIATDAIKALINMSDQGIAQGKMLKGRLVNALMEALREPDFACSRLAVMLLSNLFQTAEGCIQLLQKEDAGGALMGLHLRRLIQWFAAPARDGEDAFEYVANILHNVTQLVEARKLILEPERGLLHALLQQLQAPSVIRRRGVSGAIRNCCFQVDAAEYLLSPSLGLLTALTTPLVGPEPKKLEDAECMPSQWTESGMAHEPDAATRCHLTEALQVCASHRAAREWMRAHKLYPIIKALHEWIEGDGQGEAAGTAQGLAAAARATAEADAAAREAEQQSSALVPVGSAGHDSGSDAGEPDLSPEDERTVTAVNALVDFILRDEDAAEEEGDDAAAMQSSMPKDGAVDVPAPELLSSTAAQYGVEEMLQGKGAGAGDDEDLMGID